MAQSARGDRKTRAQKARARCAHMVGRLFLDAQAMDRLEIKTALL